MENKYYVTSFYQFKNLENLEQLKTVLTEDARKKNIEGLVILGREGVNATVASQDQMQLTLWKQSLEQLGFQLKSKDSESLVRPFQRFVVKVRDEIVTLGNPHLVPAQDTNHHLSTQEWNYAIKSENCKVIDTRNWYETRLGTFEGAMIPPIEDFSEFPAFIDQLAEKKTITAEDKILIFCTGGIRCEKAILDMQQKGYENVYQLEGGILKYLEESPHDLFKGECFVFDHRVALDQDLKPSQVYSLCPHCGQPAVEVIPCTRCGKDAKICSKCQSLEFKKETCSKNCAYHFQLHPDRRAIRPSSLKTTP